MLRNYIWYLIYTYLLSLVPSFEGRYALIVGIALGLNPIHSFIMASLGVLTLSVVLPTLLPFIDELMERLTTSKYFIIRKLALTYTTYLEKVRTKSRNYVKKWGFLGLIAFVAVPLPGTGVWTGALAAYILGIERLRSIRALIIGGLLSNIITLLPTIILYIST